MTPDGQFRTPLDKAAIRELFLSGFTKPDIGAFAAKAGFVLHFTSSA